MAREGAGRLGGKRWNQFVEDGVKRVMDRMDYLEDALLVDGYPPFTEPVDEKTQYQRLIAMKDAQAPEFWQNPDAIRDLARLSRRFGNPSPPVVGAFGELSDVRSPVRLLDYLE